MKWINSCSHIAQFGIESYPRLVHLNWVGFVLIKQVTASDIPDIEEDVEDDDDEVEYEAEEQVLPNSLKAMRGVWGGVCGSCICVGMDVCSCESSSSDKVNSLYGGNGDSKIMIKVILW